MFVKDQDVLQLVEHMTSVKEHKVMKVAEEEWNQRLTTQATTMPSSSLNWEIKTQQRLQNVKIILKDVMKNKNIMTHTFNAVKKMSQATKAGQNNCS